MSSSSYLCHSKLVCLNRNNILEGRQHKMQDPLLLHQMQDPLPKGPEMYQIQLMQLYHRCHLLHQGLQDLLNPSYAAETAAASSKRKHQPARVVASGVGYKNPSRAANLEALAVRMRNMKDKSAKQLADISSYLCIYLCSYFSNWLEHCQTSLVLLASTCQIVGFWKQCHFMYYAFLVTM